MNHLTDQLAIALRRLLEGNKCSPVRRRENRQLAESVLALIPSAWPTTPIRMVLYCPNCGAQHIDAPDGEWTNPPHRSHLCGKCGMIWRPADVATTGVVVLGTSGSADIWCPYPDDTTASPATRADLIDAARYRRLRNQDIANGTFPRPGVFVGRTDPDEVLTHADADEAVDAMRREVNR